MAESFLLVAQQVLMLYLIMAAGFVLGKARLIDDRGSVAMSNLVMYAVSPSILVVAFQRELDMASLRNFGLVLLVALAVHILAAVSVLLVRDKDPQRQSCLRFAVVFANCGFMGYPLMSAMLGSEGVFYGSAYVVVFTVLSWTLGVYIMTRDRHCLAIKPIFCNPGTISVIVAMALYLLQIQLPEILLVPITHLSNLNTPLPMVVLGYQLSHANFRVALQGRGAWVSMILRLVVLPLAALGLCLLLNLPSGLTVVLVIAASTPPAALLGQYDSAARRAAAGGAGALPAAEPAVRADGGARHRRKHAPGGAARHVRRPVRKRHGARLVPCLRADGLLGRHNAADRGAGGGA